MTTQTCLPEPTRASDYAALIAALPHTSNSTGLPGGWHVTLEIEGEPPEECDGIFVSDGTNGGQYCETGAGGSLDCLGFGNWHITDPDGGAFELTSQKLVYQGEECVGWVQTIYSGILSSEAGSFSGIGHSTTCNMLGDPLGGTRTITVTATRPNTFPVAALRGKCP
jgi:hypothetical protein